MASDPLFQRDKRKIYVSYDHHRDGRLFEAFRQACASVVDIARDLSLARELDTEDAEGYLRHLRDEAMEDASCLVILCGATSYMAKFIDWEIHAALELRMGLLGVVFPDHPRDALGEPVLPPRLRRNFDSGYAAICRSDELADGRIDLTSRVAFALDRPLSLIDNSPPLATRDG